MMPGSGVSHWGSGYLSLAKSVPIFLVWKNRAAEGGESSCHGTGKACTKTSHHLLCMVSVAISAADWMLCMVDVVQGTTSLVLHSGSVVLAWNLNTSSLTHIESL